MTKSHKTTLSLSVIAAIVVMVVAVAPLATNVDAAKTQICSSGPTAGTGPCPGNSGSNGNCNREEVTKAGKGQGSGEIKDSSC